MKRQAKHRPSINSIKIKCNDLWDADWEVRLTRTDEIKDKGWTYLTNRIGRCLKLRRG